MSAPLYRKVDPRVWDDDKFIELSDDAQILWLLILTGPQTSYVPGLMTTGVGTLSEVLRKPFERVSKAFEELLEKGLVEHDPKRRVLRVPNAPRFNPPDNPNVLKGWFRVWESAPESPLKYAHIADLEAAIDRSRGKLAETWDQTFGTVPQTLREGLPEPLPEPFGIQKQKQKQKQDQERSPPTPPQAGGADEGSPSSQPKRSRKKRELSDDAQAVRAEIAKLRGIEYPPAAFDALEARFRAKDLTPEDALGIVRYCAGDSFWRDGVKLDPTTLFRPKHWPGLLGKARAKPSTRPVVQPARPEDDDIYARLV